MLQRFLNPILIFSIALLTACSSDEPGESIPRQDIDLSRAEANVAEQQKTFAFNIFKASYSATSNATLVSPFSISQSLAMLANGASRDALDEITNLLGISIGDLQSLNSINLKLNKMLPIIDNQAKIKIANSVWAHPDLKFSVQFINGVSDYYNASSLKADMSTPEGIAAVNSWVKKASDGMIPQLYASPIDDTFAIINTLSFNGKWKYPFDKKETKKGQFKMEDGTTSLVDMMNSKGKYSINYNNNFDLLCLPYGNEAFRMMIILPKAGENLTELLSKLTKQSYTEATDNLAYTPNFEVSMPRFTVEQSSDIRTTLISLGLTETLSNNCQDLDRIFEGNKAIVNKIMAAAKIEVEESGTKASAATSISGEATDAFAFGFYVDRPFVFVIDEVSTGAILFMGAINRL